MEEWGNENQEVGELTLSQLTTLCQDYANKKEERKCAEEAIKLLSEEEKRLEAKILEYMKEYNLPNFKGGFGSISIRVNRSVAQPKDMDAKLEFFKYLRQEGIFEQMVSVNSRTLTSWVTKEIEEREKSGVFGWVPPGLEAPTEHFGLSLRKK